jgi:Protein of unknown function (DUF4038)/Domain of unknown function (DUF5060)/Putative collagen-binding domain of a collagenase
LGLTENQGVAKHGIVSKGRLASGIQATKYPAMITSHAGWIGLRFALGFLVWPLSLAPGHARAQSGPATTTATPHSETTPPPLSFAQSATTVACYDFVEVTIKVSHPTAHNPFTDAAVNGHFETSDGRTRLAVTGFCDAPDGSLFRIRFMPTAPGDWSYTVTYHQGALAQSHTGTFHAVQGHRRGLLRVDPRHPWHFLWEGTGEHYFWNGTTAFLLLGWDDERIIRDSIDRLHRLKVNRIRVLLTGRCSSFWGEPVIPGMGFRVCLNPWHAARPNDITNPGFDYSRFNVAHWQKFERMLRHARDCDMIISVILDWNDARVHPAAYSPDERRFFAYAAARFSAFSNVTWDLGDDISSYRDGRWAHVMGTYLKTLDPYNHLATEHPVDNKQQDRTAAWFDFTSFQEWHRPLHAWMLEQRREQAATGRTIPQVNEEYGYEDHYPRWSPNYPNGQSADADRRAAWGMSMAGTYQTTGETAKRGTGVWPDSGGGWINGRGDDTMVMLKGYARMVDFFTRFDWWKTDPHDEWVDHHAFCLAQPGKVYVVYLPHGGKVTVKLAPGHYHARWFNPRTGEWSAAPAAQGPRWTSPTAADDGDWALLLQSW